MQQPQTFADGGIVTRVDKMDEVERGFMASPVLYDLLGDGKLDIIQAGMDTMPEAEVVLSNAALGTRYTMISTDDGVFNSPTVVPSTGYVLDVSKKGYRSWQSGTFTVSVPN